MLNKIIQFSLQNRLFILIASVLLMIGGLYQAYHTEVDVFPDLNAPTVVVMTEAGGMAAEEVEQLVTSRRCRRSAKPGCRRQCPRSARLRLYSMLEIFSLSLLLMSLSKKEGFSTSKLVSFLPNKSG